MEDNNLKECWKEIHTGTEIKPMNIKEVIRKKHCRTISQTLRRQKTLISLFAILLAFSVAASIWDHGKRLDLPMGRKCLSAVSAGFGHWTLSAPHKVSRHIFTERIRSNAQKTAGTKNQY